MFTVIIMNDEVMGEFRKYQYLFDAFLKEKNKFSICMWNERGTDVQTSIPDLYRIVEDKKEWRAIVLVDYSNEKNSCLVDKNNPFDFAVNFSKNGKELEESDVDLIKLTHFLGGIPEPGVKRFVDRFIINVLGRKISCSNNFLKVFQDIENRFDAFKKKVSYEEHLKNECEKENNKTNRFQREQDDLDAILSQVLIDYLTILLGDDDKDDLINGIDLFKVPSYFAFDGNHITLKHFESNTEDVLPEEVNWILRIDEIELFSGKNDCMQISEKQKKEICENIVFFSKHQIKLQRQEEECDPIVMDLLFPTPTNEPEEYSNEELKKYNDIIDSRKYNFLPVRPTDILLIAMSKDLSDDDRGIVNSAWNTDLENSSSTFWERNHYPRTCRFVSVPVTNPQNAFYKKMMFEYWMIVLTFATTDIPASSLQGYRLYECGVEIDQKELKELMNSHVSRLRSMSESIRIKEEKLKKRKPNVFFEDNDNFNLEETIDVVYPGSSPESILTSNLKPCIVSDIPKDERVLWFSDKINAEKKMTVLLRNIKREVDVAGFHAHVNASLYIDEEHDIDRFHAEDIEDDRKKKENEIINANTKKLISISEVAKKMNDSERSIVNEMERRINKKTMFISALIVTLSVLAGFIPYVISIFKFSSESIGDGMIIILLTLFAVLIGGLIALLLLRRRLIQLIKKYNKEMTAFSRKIMSGAKAFSKYYSAVCTCMRERAVLDNSANKQKMRIPFRKRLRANKAKIDNAIEISKGWLYAYGIENNEDLYFVNDADINYFDIDSEINLDRDIVNDEYLRVLDPESSEKENYLPINDSEAIVKAPYGFITRLIISRKNIYDKAEKKDEERQNVCNS